MTGAAGGTGPFAGTRRLTLLALRRDGRVLPVCVSGIAALLAITARDLTVLYPTAAGRQAVAARAGANPALRFLLGRLDGTSVGAFLAARWAAWGSAFAVLMTVLIVVRHTRADEEAGRLELVGSAVTGRRAPLTAALITAGLANGVLTVLTFAWLARLRLPLAGSAALALSIGGCGLVFAGLAAASAQLAGTARGARGLALGALGAAFVLRAVGDSAPPRLSWLTWVSPLGWAEDTRSFGAAGERYWVLALPLAASAALVAAAFALAGRRDLGAGLLAGRGSRRPAASVLLRGPLGLAWRVQRLVVAGWLAAVLFAFAAGGAGARGAGSVLGSNAVLRRYLLRAGHQATVINAYLSELMLLAGLAAAVFATAAVLRLRDEETGGLAEPVLAAAAGRVRWALSHISVAVGGAAALLAGAGLATGLGYGLLTGSAGGQIPRLTGAALARLPAVLVLAALAVLALGLLPWLSAALAWGAVALTGVITVFGPPLRWPAWLMGVSPLAHVPRLPGGAVTAAPLLWLSGIALAMGAAGLAALRRRDLGDLGPAGWAWAVPFRDRLAEHFTDPAGTR